MICEFQTQKFGVDLNFYYGPCMVLGFFLQSRVKKIKKFQYLISRHILLFGPTFHPPSLVLKVSSQGLPYMPLHMTY